jgi:hypothetical protein
MSCALTQDYTLAGNCFSSKGGIRYVLIAEYENVASITVSAGAVGAMVLNTGKRFFKYELARATAEATADLQVNQENNSQHSIESIKIVLNTLTAAVSNELKSMAGNRLLIVVVDRNGNGWLFGQQYGMTAKSFKAMTGKAGADRNGYDLEFEGDEDELPPYVISSLYNSLTTPG